MRYVWQPQHVERLRQLVGVYNLSDIALRLTTEFRVPRSRTSVMRKLHRLGIGYHIPRRPRYCDCRQCTVRRWGHGALSFNPRHWTPEQDAVLDAVLPTGSTADAQVALRERCGAQRSEMAIRQRGLSRGVVVGQATMNATGVAQLLGVSRRRVEYWIKIGYLGTQGERANTAIPYRITPSDVERLIWDHGHILRAGNVKNPRLASIARFVCRRSDWIGTVEASRLLGITDRRVRGMIYDGHLSATREYPRQFRRNTWRIKRAEILAMKQCMEREHDRTAERSSA